MHTRLRWAVPVLAAAVIAVEVALVRDQLAQAWHSVISAKWSWVLAAVAAALLSIHGLAEVQRALLRSAGVIVNPWRSESAFYAGNALSTTLPGGPVVSAAFMYRQQRAWGASPVVASWQLVMSGALQVVVIALMGLGGALLIGAKTNPFSLIFTLGWVVALIVLVQAVATRPELVDGIGVRLISWVNRVRRKPRDTGVARWRELMSQLESVSLTHRAAATALSLSLLNRVADAACLLFSAYAAGGHPSPAALVVAFAAARAVGSIPLMPGGLLVVEAVLVPGLVTSGMPLAASLSAVLIYRAISWVFISTIGWVVFFFLYRSEYRGSSWQR
jgi:putative heme transporter